MDYQNKTKDELINELLKLKQDYDLLQMSVIQKITDIPNDETAEPLQESLSLYRSVLNASPDAITITDLKGRILYSSPQSFRMFGYTNPKDILNRSLFDCLDKRDHKRAQENILAILQGIQKRTHEYLGLRYDGTTFNIEVKGEYIRDAAGNPARVVYVIRDISDRKLAEEMLRKSEERYRIMVETINDVVYEIDNESIFKYVSPAVEKVFGYKAEEIIGRKTYDFIYKEDLLWIREALSLIGKSDNPYLEFRMVTHSGKICWVRTSHSLIVEQGEIVGLTGTITDVNERKMAEEALKDSEERFSKAFQTAPYAMTITRIEDGKFFEINESFTVYTGYTREETYEDSSVGLRLWKNDADRIDMISDLNNGQNIVGREYEFVKKDGTLVTCIYSANRIYLRNNPYIFSSITDITERKMAHEKIEKLSRLYEVISHVNHAIIHYRIKDKLIEEVCHIAIKYGKFQFAWIGLVDQQTKLVQPFVSDGFEDGFLSVFQPISIVDDPHKRGPIGSAIRAGNHFVFDDLLTDLRVGVWREEALKRGYRSSITIPLKEFGKIVGTFSLYSSVPNFFIPEEIELLDTFAEEISFAFEAIETENERKQAEEQLRKLSGAVEQSPVSIVIADLDGNIEYVNPKTVETTGYTAEELIGKNPRVLKSGETVDSDYKELWKNISRGREWRGIFHNRRKSGELYWESSRINPITDKNGTITHYLAVKEDITERMETQEALIKSEQRYKALFENSNSVMLLIDPESGDIKDANPPACLKYGWTHDEMCEKNISDINTLSQEDMKVEFKNAVAKKQNHFFFKHRLRSGELRDVEVFSSPVYSGKSQLLYAIVYDITDRILAETALQTREAELNYAQEIAQMGSYHLDMTNFKVMWSKNLYQMFGIDFTETEINNEIFMKMVHPEDVHLFDEKLKAIYENKNDSVFEYRIITKEGKLKWLQNILVPVFEGDTLIALKGVNIDITERKRNDDAIKKLSMAVEQSPVSIVITDLNANIEYVNPAFEKTTLFTYDEIFGKNVRILKSGKTDLSTYANLWSTIQAGNDWQGEWINQKKNGELFWEHISITPIHDEAGIITNYLAVKQDITVNKQTEQEIRDLNTNLELKIEERTSELAMTNLNLLKEIEERKRAEEALLIKTSELENFFSVSLDLLLISDSEGNFLKFNGAWETILGYSKAELKTSRFLDLIHPDDLHLTINAINQLREQQPVIDFSNRYFTKDGSLRIFEWNAAPVGQLIYAAGRDVTERKRAEEFEDELLQLSPKLTGIPQHEIEGALSMALSRIGQFLGADRSYIFEFNTDQSLMNNTFEWCNEGINPEIDNLQQIPCDILPQWMKLIQGHEKIIIPSVEDLPPSWQGEREILEPQGIQSLIIIPILSEQNLIGFVGLDSVKKKRVYNPSEINNLTVWSSMLASLINDQRSERLLEQTRQNYETFFNTIDDFLFVIDQQGNIIHTNNTVNKRLEFSKEELLNYPVLSVHPIDRREEAGRIVGEMLAGITEYCPVPIVTKSGVQIPVETRVKPGYWNGHQVIFGVSKDISQIKLSEQKFASAFHSNSAMMAISDFYKGEYIDVNNALLEILGFSREELIGKTNQDLGLFVDSDLRDMIISELLQNNPVRKIEVGLRSKDGTIKTGLISCDSIYIGDRRCLLTVTLDISERKKAEEEIKKARQAAEASNLAKSEFLSRMSHELRTPMNSILGFAQLLQMGELLPRQRSGVNHILHSGKHLLDLINEVLDISRIEAGRISLSLEPVQLNAIILEMIDSVQPLAKARLLKVELENSPSDQLFVWSDRQRLKQVLMNLLSNAIKYDHEGGSVTLKTQTMPPNPDGKVAIRISITDTGSGISEDDIPKLFTPFERIGAEKTQTEGTGLGLTVVKKLMDAMDGITGVESVLGVGSTFWIELPQCISPLESIKNHDGKLDPATISTSKTGTILYIEDNGSNIELVEQILESQRPKIELISNMNGKQAVQLAKKFIPDLILLDLNLPDIQGDDVLALLQADETTIEIPVVIISADAMPQQLENLVKAGARNYLTKPLNIQTFLKEVDKWISSSTKSKSVIKRGKSLL